MRKKRHGLLKGALALGACGAGAGVVAVSEWLFHFAIARKEWKLPDFFMKRFGDWEGDPLQKELDAAEHAMLEQPCEMVELVSSDGLRLKARFYKGEEGNKEAFLAVHGFRCHGTREFCMIQSYYKKRGASYLVIDQRACGDSEGEYMTYGAKESEDVCQWAKWLVERLGEDCSIYLHGVSLGSATVMLAAALELPHQVKGVIADCGYTSAWEEFTHQIGHLTSGHGKWIISTVNEISKRKADFDIHDAAPIEAVAKAVIPHLFIHGDGDDFVPYRMMQELYDACALPEGEKAKLTVEGAPHARSYNTNPEKYEEAVDLFLKK